MCYVLWASHLSLGCARSICPKRRRWRALQPLALDSRPQLSQRSSLSLLVQITLRDTQGGQSLSLGFPSRPSHFWYKRVQSILQWAVQPRRALSRPCPQARVRDSGADKEANLTSQRCRRKSRQFGAESQTGGRERVLTISFLQLSHFHEHYFGST